MDKESVQKMIRERINQGTLPRTLPDLTGGPGKPRRPGAHVQADVAIRVARCAACDDLGAQVTFRYATGTILRFHGRCHRLWEEECQRQSAPATPAP